MDVEKVMSYSDDLVKVLQKAGDLDNISDRLEQYHSLSSSCHFDLNHLRSFLQDYQKKLDACKQKIEEARSETAADAELDLLSSQLEEELQKEQLLKEELR
ncbi:hypothetical protein VNO78_15616 [Psophocarpus tetragonolobus]|uniref:Uncharacterized protein n=1 Tax=Psophocarpus tetragonolobus TaxID=3891 RepID=A0AAN9SGD7_PSOTE